MPAADAPDVLRVDLPEHLVQAIPEIKGFQELRLLRGPKPLVGHGVERSPRLSQPSMALDQAGEEVFETWGWFHFSDLQAGHSTGDITRCTHL